MYVGSSVGASSAARLWARNAAPSPAEASQTTSVQNPACGTCGVSPIPQDHRHDDTSSAQEAARRSTASATSEVVHPGVDAVGRHGPEEAHVSSVDTSAHGDEDKKKDGEQADGSSTGERKLSEEEKREVDDMKKRDAEVRRHEAAHAAAGGAYAGSPSFEFQVGPDGKRYAVGGEVSIDVSEVPGSPERTIAKMQAVQRAATAPESPSAQDRRVAAEAAQNEQSARQELMTELRTKAEEQVSTGEGSASSEGGGETGAETGNEATSGQTAPEEATTAPSSRGPHMPSLPEHANARAHAAVARARVAYAERFSAEAERPARATA